jgi:hypothetical protein
MQSQHRRGVRSRRNVAVSVTPARALARFALRTLVHEVVSDTARVQPAEVGFSAYFDPRNIRRYTIVPPAELDGGWESKCAKRLRAKLVGRSHAELLALLTLARIGKGALVTTVPVLYAELVQAFRTRRAALVELTLSHATSLAADVLAGYRRVRLGGEEVWLARTIDSGEAPSRERAHAA